MSPKKFGAPSSGMKPGGQSDANPQRLEYFHFLAHRNKEIKYSFVS